MTSPARWERMRLALALLAVDPAGLGGLWLRARAGPVRDAVLAALPGALAPLPLRRVPPGIDDEQLFGGIDLPATLAAGRVVRSSGLLGAGPAAMVMPMAERASRGLSARLAAALDAGEGHVLVALDEGAEPDELLAPGLAERLALHLDIGDLPWHARRPLEPDPTATLGARSALALVETPVAVLEDLTRLAARLGVPGLRAPSLALACARASAALAGRAYPVEEDLRIALDLVLAPRATQLPETAPEEETEHSPTPEPPQQEQDSQTEDPPDTPEPPPDDDEGGPDEGQAPTSEIPDEILLEAVRAALPPGVLERLAAGRAARRAVGGTSGTGAERRGNRRGRPLPSRPGKPGSEARIDLVATLRAAAPWQPIRRAAALAGEGRHLHIRAGDIRLRRFQERSDRLLIFVVDASGSTALTRLAEAKGAIELLLAEAYARRDHVALIAFRGRGAEVLLPPTRSLVQTKRRLSSLPGGGGTPLAAGLRAGLEMAEAMRGRGMTPSLAVLTDGRANIALDGAADRSRAAEDARALARALRLTETPGLVIDLGDRPQPPLRDLAAQMGAPYLPLPRADARKLSGAVAGALGPVR